MAKNTERSTGRESLLTKISSILGKFPEISDASIQTEVVRKEILIQVVRLETGYDINQKDLCHSVTYRSVAGICHITLLYNDPTSDISVSVTALLTSN